MQSQITARGMLPRNLLSGCKTTQQLSTIVCLQHLVFRGEYWMMWLNLWICRFHTGISFIIILDSFLWCRSSVNAANLWSNVAFILVSMSAKHYMKTYWKKVWEFIMAPSVFRVPKSIIHAKFLLGEVQNYKHDLACSKTSCIASVSRIVHCQLALSQIAIFFASIVN